MAFQVSTGWSSRTSDQNKTEKRLLVERRKAHGVLVYSEGKPVGWCQFGPPSELPRIDRMRNYESATARPSSWRITCFFVDRAFRRKGVAKAALEGALRALEKRGVASVEAYPHDTARGEFSASFIWHGTVRLFEQHGFVKERKLGKNHWIVRKSLA